MTTELQIYTMLGCTVLFCITMLIIHFTPQPLKIKSDDFEKLVDEIDVVVSQSMKELHSSQINHTTKSIEVISKQISGAFTKQQEFKKQYDANHLEIMSMLKRMDEGGGKRFDGIKAIVEKKEYTGCV